MQEIPLVERDPRELYEKYRRSVVCISVDQSRQASGFHVGDGYIVTARHVVEKHQFELWKNDRSISYSDIVFPDDKTIDVAVLKTNYDGSRVWNEGIPANHFVPDATGEMLLGPHPDDAVNENLVMTRIVALGYPRVARSRDDPPVLVAVDGRVSTIIRRYPGHEHPYFVISVTPRGGFSGGPVISPFDFLLGVFTESLYAAKRAQAFEGESGDAAEDEDSLEFQLGFAGAITVEPIYDLLLQNNIYPGNNATNVEEYRELVTQRDGSS
jgi:hypothetical protein